MNSMGEYPHGCELDWLTSLAVQQCDGHDGVVDGIISNPRACSFDPFAYVGTNFTCLTDRRSMELSKAAAVIANASWAGPTDFNGNFIWYGLNHGTDLSSDITGTGIAATSCNDSVCKGNPIPLAYQWIQLFVEKDPNYDYIAITRENYDEIMRRSGAEFDAIVASSNPNLTEFYEVGGKMMTYHGLVRKRLNYVLFSFLFFSSSSATRLTVMLHLHSTIKSYRYKPPSSIMTTSGNLCPRFKISTGFTKCLG